MNGLDVYLEVGHHKECDNCYRSESETQISNQFRGNDLKRGKSWPRIGYTMNGMVGNQKHIFSLIVISQLYYERKYMYHCPGDEAK
jgi:hypothetical protein